MTVLLVLSCWIEFVSSVVIAIGRHPGRSRECAAVVGGGGGGGAGDARAKISRAGGDRPVGVGARPMSRWVAPIPIVISARSSSAASSVSHSGK
jgi:hypothetical protein